MAEVYLTGHTHKLKRLKDFVVLTTPKGRYAIGILRDIPLSYYSHLHIYADTLDTPSGISSSKDEGAKKFDNDKLPLDLIPKSALDALAEVLKFGAKKYDPHNWRKGMAWSRMHAAAMRHLTKYWEGEEVDEESGLSHLWHALTCIAFLIEYAKSYPEGDDRYKKESLESLSYVTTSPLGEETKTKITGCVGCITEHAPHHQHSRCRECKDYNRYVQKEENINNVRDRMIED